MSKFIKLEEGKNYNIILLNPNKIKKFLYYKKDVRNIKENGCPYCEENKIKSRFEILDIR